jgi:hypothetical protein
MSKKIEKNIPATSNDIEFDVSESEDPSFEPGFQPGSLPKISMPELPDDAESLTAEALVQVPTLTEWADENPGQELVDLAANVTDTPVVEVKQPDETPVVAAPDVVVARTQPTASVQEKPFDADVWAEQLKTRMGKLTGAIHTLQSRLDQLNEDN